MTTDHTPTPEPMPEPCQAAFEEWYSNGDKDCPSILKNENGSYRLMQAMYAWEGFRQAWIMKADLSRPAVGDTWQPIESIGDEKKNGKRVLLMNIDLYLAGETSIMDDYWYQDRMMGAFDNWNEAFDVPPTHWTHLPSSQLTEEKAPQPPAEDLRKVREALDDAFHAIMASGPIVRAFPEKLEIHKAALDKAAEALSILDRITK